MSASPGRWSCKPDQVVTWSVRGVPGLERRRAGKQRDHDRRKRGELTDGRVTSARDHPGVGRERQSRPLDW